MLELLRMAEEQPEVALRRIGEQRERGAPELFLIETEIRANLKLGRVSAAEELARTFASRAPDAHSVRLLADICELQGRADEASALRRRASTMPDRHVNDEVIRTLMSMGMTKLL